MDYGTGPGLEPGICLVKFDQALMAHCMKTAQQFGPIETLSAVNMADLPDLFCPFCQKTHRIVSWMDGAAFSLLRLEECSGVRPSSPVAN